MLEKLLQFIQNLLETWQSRESERTLGAARGPLWNQTKREYEKLHPKRCRYCLTTIGVELHHVILFSERPDLEYEFSNLVWLCRRHHLEQGHLGSFRAKNLEIIRDCER